MGTGLSTASSSAKSAFEAFRLPASGARVSGIGSNIGSSTMGSSAAALPPAPAATAFLIAHAKPFGSPPLGPMAGLQRRDRTTSFERRQGRFRSPQHECTPSPGHQMPRRAALPIRSASPRPLGQSKAANASASAAASVAASAPPTALEARGGDGGGDDSCGAGAGGDDSGGASGWGGGGCSVAVLGAAVGGVEGVDDGAC
jgi:hypothetical protein